MRPLPPTTRSVYSDIILAFFTLRSPALHTTTHSRRQINLQAAYHRTAHPVSIVTEHKDPFQRKPGKIIYRYTFVKATLENNTRKETAQDKNRSSYQLGGHCEQHTSAE